MFCPSFLDPGVSAGSARTALEALPPGASITGLDDLADAVVAEIMEPRFVGHRVGIVSVAG
jgi:hypothetical protein